MSADEGVEAVFSRAMKDSAFRDLLLTFPEQALTGFNLTTDEITRLKGLCFAQFESLAIATPEERRLFFLVDRLDIRNIMAFENLYDHEQMIADSVRVDTYYEAISRYIKPDDVVIDLGTGSGILAFFAARQKARRVYAIEHSNFIEIAEKIAIHNNINNITFVKSNSRNFTPPTKVDYILHEQLGYAIFNENMLKNILDLKRRVLKDTGKILPGKFELYIEPASLNNEYRVPFIWEKEVHGIDFSFLKTNKVVDKYKSPSYKSRFIQPSAIDTYLCNPEPILRFDMNEMMLDDELPRKLKCSKQVSHTGQLDGLSIFFKVIFDDTLYFDTSPLHKYTCWDKCLMRLESKSYNEGDIIHLDIDMADITNVNSWLVMLD